MLRSFISAFGKSLWRRLEVHLLPRRVQDGGTDIRRILVFGAKRTVTSKDGRAATSSLQKKEQGGMHTYSTYTSSTVNFCLPIMFLDTKES
jgi:hypothetical protein